MPNEDFSNLEHQIRRYQDDLAKQAKELSELRSELACLKQMMGTVREALRCIDTYSYKGGMTSDAERKAHAQLAEFMNKGF
jgi:septal ring factor EnvC (AmiA/AmiB activator)